MTAAGLVIALLLVGGGVYLYNRLVADRNQVRAGWSDIDVQLTRRHELVPRLVEAVKGYASHERATLEAVTALRQRSTEVEQLALKAGLEQELEAGVRKLIALAEDYPDLKSSENFLALQRELVEIEDHLQYARRFYNGAVRVFNTRIESVPDLIVARLFDFQPAEFFATTTRDAPMVKL
jgi:LemA protein